MLNNIIIGSYYPVKSKIHSMNPISKIICTIVFIVMCFLANSASLNIILLLLTIIMILNANIPFKIFSNTLKSMKFLILFLLVINIILKVNIELTIVLLLRIVLIVLYTTILTLTTPPTEIAYGLEKVFLPLYIIGIPVKKISLSITFALRFIPSIIDEANKILKSQASRGVDYKSSNLKNKIIALKSIVIPMFILTIKRADLLAESMEVRLYNINKKRTNFKQNRWGSFDTYLCLIHLLFLAVIIKKGVVV